MHDSLTNHPIADLLNGVVMPVIASAQPAHEIVNYQNYPSVVGGCEAVLIPEHVCARHTQWAKSPPMGVPHGFRRGRLDVPVTTYSRMISRCSACIRPRDSLEIPFRIGIESSTSTNGWNVREKKDTLGTGSSSIL